MKPIGVYVPEVSPFILVAMILNIKIIPETRSEVKKVCKVCQICLFSIYVICTCVQVCMFLYRAYITYCVYFLKVIGTSVCRMKFLAAAMLVSLLLLWAPASVQGRRDGAPSDACVTFIPQHLNYSQQPSEAPYALDVSEILLQDNQTCYVPDQEYTSEFVVLCTCAYTVGQ